MKALFLSGGAAKFISLVSAARHLMFEKLFIPNLVVGSSSGAITTLMLCMGKLDVATQIGVKIKIKDIFSKAPFKEDGSLTIGAAWRFVKGVVTGKCNSLGEIDNLRKLLKKHVSKAEFEAYQKDDTKPVGIIMTVNASTRQRRMFNLKHVDYNTAIEAVIGSSAIAGIMPAAEINGEHYYDGGYRDHCPGSFILSDSLYRDKITEFVSVYTRPQDYKTKRSDKWRKNFIMALLDFSMTAMNMEISKGDEYTELQEQNKLGLHGSQVFIEPFLEWQFDTDEQRLSEGYFNGIKAVDKYYKKPKQ